MRCILTEEIDYEHTCTPTVESANNAFVPFHTLPESFTPLASLLDAPPPAERAVHLMNVIISVQRVIWVCAAGMLATGVSTSHSDCTVYISFLRWKHFFAAQISPPKVPSTSPVSINRAHTALKHGEACLPDLANVYLCETGLKLLSQLMAGERLVCSRCINVPLYSDLRLLMSLPDFADFVHDVLIYCENERVRRTAGRVLAQICGRTTDSSAQLFDVMIKHGQCCMRQCTHTHTGVQLWPSAATVRGKHARVLRQSNAYFQLRALLFEKLTDTQLVAVKAERMLLDETQWLRNYTPTTDDVDACAIDCVLLAGHMRLMCALLHRLHDEQLAAETGTAIVSPRTVHVGAYCLLCSYLRYLPTTCFRLVAWLDRATG
jgi:hypothetical protein